MWRRQAKSSHEGTTTVRPRRFLPRLEALETRLAPASCTWAPVSKVVTGDADGDTLTVIHRLNGGGYDLICNYFEYVATTPDIGLTFDAGPGSTLSIDNRFGGWRHYDVEPGHIEDSITDVRVNFNDNVQQLLLYFADVDQFSGTWNEVEIGRDGVLNHIPLTSVYGNDGNADKIVVNDSEWDGGDTYRITDSQLLLPAQITVNHGNVDEIYLRTGTGDDTIRMENTSGAFANMPSLVTKTSSGADTLVLDASTNPQGQALNFDTRGMWQYLDPFNIYVLTYEADDQVELKGGSGQDTVTVYPDALNPALDLDGGGGDDALRIEHTANTLAEAYTVTGLGVSNTAGLIAAYLSFKTLWVGTGTSDDTVNIGNGFLETFLPAITVDGGEGFNALLVDDSQYHFGDTYEINGDRVSVPAQALDVLYSDFDQVIIATGNAADTINVKNTSGSLGTMPHIFAISAVLGDTVNLDGSNSTGDEHYLFNGTAVYMPVYGKDLLSTSGVHYVNLTAGTGSDTVTIGPAMAINFEIGVDGGGGTNSLIVDDSAFNRGPYEITSNEVSESSTLGLIATYANIFNLTLKTGAGDNQIGVGNAFGTLTGMPGLRIESGAGNDVLFVRDHNNPNNDPYHFVRFTATDSNLSTPSLGLAKFFGVETINLLTGPGNNEINVDNGKGFLPQAMAFNVLGSGGNDTLNYRDNKNTSATTYVVTSTGPGSGSVNVPAVGFNVSFTNTISAVNLFTSLKPGTVVDTSSYNPAHYVLNIVNNVGGFNHQKAPAESVSVQLWNPIPPPPLPNQGGLIPAFEEGDALDRGGARSDRMLDDVEASVIDAEALTDSLAGRVLDIISETAFGLLGD